MSKKAEMTEMAAIEAAEVREAAFVEEGDMMTESRLASEITMLTEQTKQVVLFNSIEIGRRLVEAKKIVKHGQWGKWLKERVDYSQRTANNFMKIFEEYGQSGLAAKSQSIASLSYTQALTLLELPREQRQGFVEQNDPKDLTIKELQKKIADLVSEKSTVEARLADNEKSYQRDLADKNREKEETEKKAESLEGRIRDLEQRAKEAEAVKERELQEKLAAAIKAEKEELEEARKAAEELEKQIADLREKRDAEVEEARQEEKKRGQEELAKRDREIERFKERLKEQVQKAAKDMAEARTEVAEEQAKNQLAGELAKGSYLIEEVLDGYAELMDILMGIRKRDKVRGDELLSDLENSMEKIRRKANIKIVAS